MRSVAIRDAHGAVARWYGTCTDVDDLKRAESVVDNIGDAFVGVDRELLITFANPAALRLVGRDRTHVIGRALFDAVTELAGTPLVAAIERARGGEQRVAVDAGRYHVRIYPARNHDGMTLLFEARKP
jgi:PAS domain S-box-containing protein